MREGALMCRKEAWGDFEKRAEGSVLRVSMKKSTPEVVVPGRGPVSMWGKKGQRWGPSGEAQGLSVGTSNAGLRQGLGIGEKRQGKGAEAGCRGRVQR